LDRGQGEVGAAFDPGGRRRAKMLDIQKRRVQLMLFITGVLALSMTGQLPAAKSLLSSLVIYNSFYPLLAEANSCGHRFLVTQAKVPARLSRIFHRT
jgi:hypothetical protein